MAYDEVAERKARQAELGAGDGAILSVTSGSTVYEYMDAFVSTRKIKSANNPAGLVRLTCDGYRYAIRSMDRGFGSIRLHHLKPTRILAWQKSLERQGKAGAMINRAYWCPKNACKYAVQNGDWTPSSSRCVSHASAWTRPSRPALTPTHSTIQASSS
jgi:hypothetical protein